MPYGSIDPSVVKNLPQWALESIAAAQPPPGLVSNFVNPPTMVPALLGVSSAFLGLAGILYLIRVYVKVFIDKVYWDDLCCTLGFAFALVYYYAVVLGCNEAGLGRHMWDLPIIDFISGPSLLSKYLVITMITPALGFTKLCLFIQYYRIFWPFRWVRISVWVGGIIACLFYVTVSICAFVLNSPWPGETLLDSILSNRYSTFASFSVPQGVVGMVIDIYLIVLPIGGLWKLNMNTNKKIGLSIIFLTGIMASVSSIVGLYFRVRELQEPNDVSWPVAYLHLFLLLEIFGGVSCACMPSAYKFLTSRKRTGEALMLSLISLKKGFLKGMPEFGESTDTCATTELETAIEITQRSDKGSARDKSTVVYWVR